MNRKSAGLSTLLLLILTASSAWAVDGVLNFGIDAQSPTYLKAWDLPFAQEVYGVEIYENDANAPAQTVALLASDENGAADPATAVTLSPAGSATGGWQQYLLATLQNNSGRLWIRVSYATGDSDLNRGTGGGPAIGYSVVSQPLTTPQLVSADAGASYDRLDAKLNLAANLLLDGGSVVLNRRAGDSPSTDALRGRQLAVHPNPFNPRTTVEFRMDVAGTARVRVFDLRGRMVATLLNEALSAGRHQLSWNATDANGASLASGVYLVALDGPSGRVVERVALVQ
jgi:FlgD Ig-like domain